MYFVDILTAGLTPENFQVVFAVGVAASLLHLLGFKPAAMTDHHAPTHISEYPQNTCTKEPYTSTKEPYASIKEPFTSAKEAIFDRGCDEVVQTSADPQHVSLQKPCISAKEPCISAKEPCISSKEPCPSAKEPAEDDNGTACGLLPSATPGRNSQKTACNFIHHAKQLES